jgi:hypothetical protein
MDRQVTPVLLTFWFVECLLVVCALTASAAIWLVVVLVAPILALATRASFAGAEGSDRLVLRPQLRAAYYIALGAVAIGGAAGVVAAAHERAPIAILFLLAFVTAYRAIVRPLPRHAASPGAWVLVLWIPITIVQLGLDLQWAGWRGGVLVAGAVVLVGSALASVLSLAAFVEPPDAVASARLTRG